MFFLYLDERKNGEYQGKTENIRESWRMLETATFKSIYLSIIVSKFALANLKVH